MELGAATIRASYDGSAVSSGIAKNFSELQGLDKLGSNIGNQISTGLSKSFKPGDFGRVGEQMAQSLVAPLSASFGSLGPLAATTAAALGPVGIAAGVAAAGLVLLGSAVTSAASTWEAGLAKISKTTGIEQGTVAFANLSSGLKDLMARMPTTASEIQNVASAAGSLGIEQSSIAGFTEVSLKMGSAFEIPAEQAANGIAKIKAQTKGLTMDSAQFAMSFGSVVDTMGNSFAATEGQVLDFSTRTASSLVMLNGNVNDVAGWGGKLISTFPSAELAAGSFNALVTNMSTNKEAIAESAKLLGVTDEQFRKMVSSNPSETILEVADAVNKLPSEQQGTLAKTIGGGYGDDAFKRIITNTNDYRDALGQARIAAVGAFDPKLFSQNESAQAEAAKLIGLTTDQFKEQLKANPGEVYMKMGDALGKLDPSKLEGVKKNLQIGDLSIEGSFGRSIQNAQAQWQIFTNSLQAAAIDLGTPLLGPITTGLSAMGSGVNSLRGLGESVFGAVIASPAFAQLQNIGSTISSGFGNIAGNLAGPLGQIKAALDKAVGGDALQVGINAITAPLTVALELTNQLASGFMTVAGAVGSIGGGALSGVASTIEEISANLKVAQAYLQAFGEVTGLSNVFSGVSSTIDKIVTGLSQAGPKVAEGLSGVFHTMVSSVQAAIDDVISTLVTKFVDVMQVFKPVLDATGMGGLFEEVNAKAQAILAEGGRDAGKAMAEETAKGIEDNTKEAESAATKLGESTADAYIKAYGSGMDAGMQWLNGKWVSQQAENKDTFAYGATTVEGVSLTSEIDISNKSTTARLRNEQGRIIAQKSYGWGTGPARAEMIKDLLKSVAPSAGKVEQLEIVGQYAEADRLRLKQAVEIEPIIEFDLEAAAARLNELAPEFTSKMRLSDRFRSIMGEVEKISTAEGPKAEALRTKGNTLIEALVEPTTAEGLVKVRKGLADLRAETNTFWEGTHGDTAGQIVGEYEEEFRRGIIDVGRYMGAEYEGSSQVLASSLEDGFVDGSERGALEMRKAVLEMLKEEYPLNFTSNHEELLKDIDDTLQGKKIELEVNLKSVWEDLSTPEGRDRWLYGNKDLVKNLNQEQGFGLTGWVDSFSKNKSAMDSLSNLFTAANDQTVESVDLFERAVNRIILIDPTLAKAGSWLDRLVMDYIYARPTVYGKIGPLAPSYNEYVTPRKGQFWEGGETPVLGYAARMGSIAGVEVSNPVTVEGNDILQDGIFESAGYLKGIEPSSQQTAQATAKTASSVADLGTPLQSIDTKATTTNTLLQSIDGKIGTLGGRTTNVTNNFNQAGYSQGYGGTYNQSPQSNRLLVASKGGGIFDVSGYKIPKFQEGGYVAESGIAHVEKGEIVLSPDQMPCAVSDQYQVLENPALFHKDTISSASTGNVWDAHDLGYNIKQVGEGLGYLGGCVRSSTQDFQELHASELFYQTGGIYSTVQEMQSLAEALPRTSRMVTGLGESSQKASTGLRYVEERWMDPDVYNRWTITPPNSGFQSSSKRGYVPVMMSEEAEKNKIYSPFADISTWDYFGMPEKIRKMQRQYSGKSSVMPVGPHEEPDWIVKASGGVVTKQSEGLLNPMAVSYKRAADSADKAAQSFDKFGDVTDSKFYEVLKFSDSMRQASADNGEYCEVLKESNVALEEANRLSSKNLFFKQPYFGPTEYAAAAKAYFAGQSYESLLPGGKSDMIGPALTGATAASETLIEDFNILSEGIFECTGSLKDLGVATTSLNYATGTAIQSEWDRMAIGGRESQSRKWSLTEFEAFNEGLQQCYAYMSDWATFQEGILGPAGYFAETYLGLTEGWAGPGKGAKPGYMGPNFQADYPDWGPWRAEAQKRGMLEEPASSQQKGYYLIPTGGGKPVRIESETLKSISESSKQMADTQAETNEGIYDLRDAFGDMSGDLIDSQGNLVGNVANGLFRMAVGYGGGGGSGAMSGGRFGGSYGSFFGNSWYGGGAAGLGASHGSGGYSGSMGGAASASAGSMGRAAGGTGHGSAGSVRWAEGGLLKVNSPTLFQMPGGGVGMAGEAGPELMAILPLNNRDRMAELLSQIAPMAGVRPFASGGLVGALPPKISRAALGSISIGDIHIHEAGNLNESQLADAIIDKIVEKVAEKAFNDQY